MNLVKNGLTISRITIRFNKEEASNFNAIKVNYPKLSNSKLIKSLVFKEFKPFLNDIEKAIIVNYICELNAIGKNLNQLLKYKAFNDCKQIIQDIKQLVNEAQKIL